jgi:predicted nucleic acid binding AN1-type Zn finger protein
MIVDNHEENKECENKKNKEMDEKKNKRSNREKKTRCTFCNKKTGLISFTCDCGGVLCSAHLNAHSHDCCLLLEKKDERQKQLTENNPRIDFKKVEVI